MVKTEHGLHMRPISAVAMLATRYDCDLYVHRDGMPYWNFLLEGCPYLNVKSVVSFLSIGIILGEQLEFIATGAQATTALKDLSRLLTQESASHNPPPNQV